MFWRTSAHSRQPCHPERSEGSFAALRMTGGTFLSSVRKSPQIKEKRTSARASSVFTGCLLNTGSGSRRHNVAWHVLEGLGGVDAGLLGHLEHALGDDVALDFVGAAGDRGGGHRDEDFCDHALHRTVL